MTAMRVTRDVAASEPHNYLGRTAHTGEIFYTFHRPTYGAVDHWNGIALSEIDGEYPFFEFPSDAVTAVTP
jgi:hypothetical protein